MRASDSENGPLYQRGMGNGCPSADPVRDHRYPNYGDLFGWLTIAALVGLTIWSMVRGKRFRYGEAAR